MLKNLKENLHKFSLEDLAEYYCNTYGFCACTLSKEDYEEHILRYYRQYLKCHKLNINMLVKANKFMLWYYEKINKLAS